MKKFKAFIPASILLVVSFITHFIFFGNPQAVVFDEFYTGSFLTSYWQGKYFFDIHPPLGKLLLMYFSQLVGGGPGADWSAIGNALPHWVVFARILPMVAGTLLPLVVYGICRLLKMSKFSSFVAGLLVCFENSLIVQSRYLLTDSMLVLFGFLALYLYLMYRQYIEDRENKKDAGHKKIAPAWKSRLIIFLSAFFAAASASTKWTGLAFLLIIAILEIIRIFKRNASNSHASIPAKKISQKISQKIEEFSATGIWYFIVFVVMYFSVFAIHFSLLPNSGPGDLFMSPSFQKTLTGNVYATSTIVAPEGLFAKFTELNYEMYHANATLTQTHPYSSKWYTWPFMIRPIFYWQSDSYVVPAPGTPGWSATPVPTRAYVYLLGNPLVYWPATAAVLAMFFGGLWIWIRKKAWKAGEHIMSEKRAYTFIMLGYAVNFLPFIFIGRVMFLYHYEAALVFSIMAVAFLLDRISNKKMRTITGVTLVVLVVASFIFFSPLTYGLQITDHQLAIRMWLSSWR